MVDNLMGLSAVAKASYNARNALRNERGNETCDRRPGHFSEKRFSDIFTRKDARPI
jgi:hypothetical protein